MSSTRFSSSARDFERGRRGQEAGVRLCGCTRLRTCARSFARVDEEIENRGSRSRKKTWQLLTLKLLDAFGALIVRIHCTYPWERLSTLTVENDGDQACACVMLERLSSQSFARRWARVSIHILVLFFWSSLLCLMSLITGKSCRRARQ